MPLERATRSLRRAGGMLDAVPGRQHTVATALERIAAKARREPQRTCTSFAHHLTLNRLRDHLGPMEKTSAAGVDGYPLPRSPQTWTGERRRSCGRSRRKGIIRRPCGECGDQNRAKPNSVPWGCPRSSIAPSSKGRRRCWKPSMHRTFSTARWWSTRPGAHHALATLNAIIAGKQVEYVQADLRNVFGSLDQTWAMRFVQLRVGDPRMLTRMRRWLTAGVMRPDGTVEDGEWDTPRGQYPWAPQSCVPA